MVVFVFLVCLFFSVFFVFRFLDPSHHPPVAPLAPSASPEAHEAPGPGAAVHQGVAEGGLVPGARLLRRVVSWGRILGLERDTGRKPGGRVSWVGKNPADGFVRKFFLGTGKKSQGGFSEVKAARPLWACLKKAEPRKWVLVLRLSQANPKKQERRNL